MYEDVCNLSEIPSALIKFTFQNLKCKLIEHFNLCSDNRHISHDNIAKNHPFPVQNDRHRTYNVDVRSCNHYWSGREISDTYSECVFVALSIQCAMRMRLIVICGLSGSTKLFHIISHVAVFRKKIIEHEKCVLIFSSTFV